MYYNGRNHFVFIGDIRIRYCKQISNKNNINLNNLRLFIGRQLYSSFIRQLDTNYNVDLDFEKQNIFSNNEEKNLTYSNKEMNLEVVS